MKNRKITLLVRAFSLQIILGLDLMFMPTFSTAQATGNGAAALTTTATTIKSYGVAAQTIVLALGVVIGLIGAVRVYSKFHNGDPDTQKAMVSWFGAALFLVAVGSILTAFFGA
ncbi:DUF4134 family protein [Spirosoma oryzicola]|uniref:DUF4134 family protein n=1 Tax=Spirosoma oryzicola TaxID=2898794 RepID=UPI001E364A76|nr:DUF4134 family protein [Spirosoma oryzicola]UHG94691.1 DUF4134 domain-containing protein [Spirosoma oryzicola]